MKQQPNTLSSRYNLSWGFLPIVFSMILSEWITHSLAIYIGMLVGMAACMYERFMFHNPKRSNTLLLYTTGMLVLLSTITLIIPAYAPPSLIPLSLEISALIPPALILVNRKKHFKEAEATLATSKVVMLLGVIHFLLISFSVMIAHPLNETTFFILFHILPPALFIGSIVFNQAGIIYFNKLMKKAVFLPVVNNKGTVIGKTLASNILRGNNELIIPVIRIAVIVKGMIYLRPRSCYSLAEQGKNDLPIEGYLTYGESLEQGIKRLMQQVFPNTPLKNLRFNLKYHYKNSTTNRLVYLFLLDLTDDTSLNTSSSQDGKLWTLNQIEHNMKNSFFSIFFENEFEYLKVIICTKEKYKES